MTPEAIVAIVVGSLTAIGLVWRALSLRELERKVDALAAKIDMSVIRRIESVEEWVSVLRERAHDANDKLTGYVLEVGLLKERIRHRGDDDD